MRYLMIDKKSRSYRIGINWICKLCIQYLTRKGIIAPEEYASKVFEQSYFSGRYDAIRSIRHDLNRDILFETFKKDHLS